MKNNRTIIATYIVTAFACSPAFAMDSWHFHEDDWGKTRSYAAVLISQDSVDNWGAWGDFVEPAAGAPLQVAMPGMTAGDSYRNNPSTAVAASDICGAGDWCGYAIFNDTTRTSGAQKKSSYGHGNPKQSFSAGLFALTLTPDSSEITAGEGAGSGNNSWRLKSMGTTDPNFANSGTNLETAFGGGSFNPEEWHWEYKKVSHGDYIKNKGNYIRVKDGTGNYDLVKIVDTVAGEIYDNRDAGLHHFSTNGSETGLTAFSHNIKANEASTSINKGGVGSGYFEQALTGYKHTYWEKVTVTIWGHTFSYWDLKSVMLQADADVAIGTFKRVENYISGATEGSADTTTTTSTTGYYVAGIATPQTYLDSQRTGNVTATYVGGSFDGSQQGKVNITVNFQPGTWTGNWSNNGGFDFNAAGTVSGANITGGVVDTVHTTGTVNGTFYGQQAGSIGGVSNVTKTTSYGPPQTQAAIFLVNKVPTLPAPSSNR